MFYKSQSCDTLLKETSILHNFIFVQFSFFIPLILYLCSECNSGAATHGGGSGWSGVWLRYAGIFVWVWYAGIFVDYDMQVCWCWCWWCWRWCYCQDQSYSELCFNMVYRKDLEETASVGRGSPVQQELEDSETEARRFFFTFKNFNRRRFFSSFFLFYFQACRSQVWSNPSLITKDCSWMNSFSCFFLHDWFLVLTCFFYKWHSCVNWITINCCHFVIPVWWSSNLLSPFVQGILILPRLIHRYVHCPCYAHLFPYSLL